MRRIRQAFNAATAMPIDGATFGIPTNRELEGINGPAPSHCGTCHKAYRASVATCPNGPSTRIDHDKPDKVLCRLWWPRLVAQITEAHGRAQLGRVFWIDDPEDRREAIIKAACETFILQMSGEEE